MDSDIRYEFLDSLDHFPSSLIRTLWLIQDINAKLQQDRENRILHSQLLNQSDYLKKLVKRQRSKLEWQREQLVYQKAVLRRYHNIASKNKHGRILPAFPADPASKVSLPKITKKKVIVDVPTSPSEPTYCICRNIAHDRMIACDNDKCPIEWYHYECIGIMRAPKGKWYCSDRCLAQATGKKRRTKNKSKKTKKR